MPKIHTRFVCQQCGKVTSKSFGRCPQCGSYASMVEEVISAPAAPARSGNTLSLVNESPMSLAEITGDAEERFALPIAEFARVLGGGIVPGSIVLVGGDPGIGKSTLLLQMAMEVAPLGKVLYVSGEESVRQIKMRALRLMRNGEAGVAIPQTCCC